jgi:uncharacterized protein
MADKYTGTPPSERTVVRRLPERGRYERDTIDKILDEALVCHVGFVADAQPYVIPTLHVRMQDRLYLHGAVANRMLRTLEGGVDVCVTVTLLDGLVLSRSWFHHSVNYRSVVVLGRAVEVTDRDEKVAALRSLVEHVVPGRSGDSRAPSDTELRRTRVLAIPLDEASAKVRAGPPKEEADDLALPYWGGEVPMALRVTGAPVADSHTPAEWKAPGYIAELHRT